MANGVDNGGKPTKKKTGGLSPKRKGNAYERELVQAAQDAGLPSKRAWGSNGQALGHHEEVDLLIGDQRVQAKRRKALPEYLVPSAEVDAQALRADRGPSYVVLRLSDYLELLKKTRQSD